MLNNLFTQRKEKNMCHIHEAIHSISKMSESDKITIWVDGAEIHGTIFCCDESGEGGENKCFEDILTLKEACASCGGEKKHYKWLNIPTYGIQGFTFDCGCK